MSCLSDCVRWGPSWPPPWRDGLPDDRHQAVDRGVVQRPLPVRAGHPGRLRRAPLAAAQGAGDPAMSGRRRRRILLSGLLVVATLGLSACNGATDAEKR